MKIFFTFVYFFLSIGCVWAEVQANSNQDKPWRLYVKSYNESTSGRLAGVDHETYPPDPYYETIITTTTLSESVSYSDNHDGFAWNELYENMVENYSFEDSSGSANLTGDDSLKIIIGAGLDPTSAPVTQTETFTGHNTTSGTSEGVVTSFSADAVPQTNSYAGIAAIPWRSEHCDVGFPFRDDSLHGSSGNESWNFIESYHRTAQTQWKLQTGGKALATRRNLFGLSGSAAQILPTAGNLISDFVNVYNGYTESDGWINLSSIFSQFNFPSDDMSLPRLSVSPQNVLIGANGACGSGGVLFVALPDNADLDVTPTVVGADVYTIGISANKYHCYFDVYVKEADPGGIAPYSAANDVGHAWYGLRTDAPSGALLSLLSASNYWFLTNHVGSEMSGTFGYYPSLGELSPVNCPGILEVPETHQPSEATVARTFDVGFEGFCSALQFAADLSASPGTYDLISHNCVQAVRDAASAAGGQSADSTDVPQYFGMGLAYHYPNPTNIMSVLWLP